MSTNIDNLSETLLKYIFAFLSFKQIYYNIAGVNKHFNKCCRQLRDNYKKISEFYMPLFSKNFEFSNLVKLEITFNKFCNPKPIQINSQFLKKIKLRFEPRFKVIKNIQNYISIDTIEKVKSIKIIIKSWESQDNFNEWSQTLDKILLPKIKIYYKTK